MSESLRNTLVYISNNSGGSWWLKDEHWFALEDAGWVVHWAHDRALAHGDVVHEPTEWTSFEHTHAYEHELVAVPRPTGNERRWLGALAKSAAKATTDPDAAIAEWERLTNQSASDEGCNCCGEPHSFTFYNAEGERRWSHVEVTATSLEWN